MTRVLLDADAVHVPGWVSGLASFRRWTEEEPFPESVAVAFIHGEVWIDLSREQLFSHNQVKTEINSTLRSLAKSHQWGRYFAWGAYLSNAEADFSTQPDGIFVSAESLVQQHVRFVEGQTEGHVDSKAPRRGPRSRQPKLRREGHRSARTGLTPPPASANTGSSMPAATRSGSTSSASAAAATPPSANRRAGCVRRVQARWFRLARQDGASRITLQTRADKPA